MVLKTNRVNVACSTSRIRLAYWRFLIIIIMIIMIIIIIIIIIIMIVIIKIIIIIIIIMTMTMTMTMTMSMTMTMTMTMTMIMIMIMIIFISEAISHKVVAERLCGKYYENVKPYKTMLLKRVTYLKCKFSCYSYKRSILKMFVETYETPS